MLIRIVNGDTDPGSELTATHLGTLQLEIRQPGLTRSANSQVLWLEPRQAGMQRLWHLPSTIVLMCLGLKGSLEVTGRFVCLGHNSLIGLEHSESHFEEKPSNAKAGDA